MDFDANVCLSKNLHCFQYNAYNLKIPRCANVSYSRMEDVEMSELAWSSCLAEKFAKDNNLSADNATLISTIKCNITSTALLKVLDSDTIHGLVTSTSTTILQIVGCGGFYKIEDLTITSGYGQLTPNNSYKGFFLFIHCIQSLRVGGWNT
ncbi:hypothetical protein GQX74_014511 [Glossina fuscipes]|nr:hypothetical protein GQX74_014511 [Glossina fuscipes]